MTRNKSRTERPWSEAGALDATRGWRELVFTCEGRFPSILYTQNELGLRSKVARAMQGVYWAMKEAGDDPRTFSTWLEARKRGDELAARQRTNLAG